MNTIYPTKCGNFLVQSRGFQILWAFDSGINIIACHILTFTISEHEWTQSIVLMTFHTNQYYILCLLINIVYVAAIISVMLGALTLTLSIPGHQFCDICVFLWTEEVPWLLSNWICLSCFLDVGIRFLMLFHLLITKVPVKAAIPNYNRSPLHKNYQLVFYNWQELHDNDWSRLWWSTIVLIIYIQFMYYTHIWISFSGNTCKFFNIHIYLYLKSYF